MNKDILIPNVDPELGARAISILENTISTLVSKGVTTIPVGVLNDILDLLTYTKLNQLPEE